ncbi:MULTISPECIES: hypothetical protein [unclassified Cryobacterium]|uniref:hypothetical protein n=1 Tax=unclassified Cryobacterium TaxID=2649013 RepID=UPI002AB4C3BB|nr:MULTISPECIES: hypothetical protein [unclassified Cryobacterium]MDY7555949.1 hypothetical protein [Cryobacterium sp. 10C3]MEB0002497.1 hypothetical protein [Cryobacterium sp. RTC2.1]
MLPTPELSDDEVFDLFHGELSRLIGEQGLWTLVPRSPADTDVIFHGLKARQVAASLTSALRSATSELRGESVGEPAALSFTPAPITVWAEPDAAARKPTAPQAERFVSAVPLPGYTAVEPAERARLVA